LKEASVVVPLVLIHGAQEKPGCASRNYEPPGNTLFLGSSGNPRFGGSGANEKDLLQLRRQGNEVPAGAMKVQRRWSGAAIRPIVAQEDPN
jgi:hypothetical protein